MDKGASEVGKLGSLLTVVALVDLDSEEEIEEVLFVTFFCQPQKPGFDLCVD